MADQIKKRKRKDESSVEVLTYQRSPTWFEDGNIVLRAENIEYRVHRSVLASHSCIFKDMFSVPQPPPESQETVEGCAVIRLSDSSEDISNLLFLLYDNFRVHTIRQPMSLSVMTTMLRMGKKYRFRHLRAEAIHSLKEAFPSGLKAFDDRKPSAYTKKDLFDLVCIAHEHSIKSILPAVFLLIM